MQRHAPQVARVFVVRVDVRGLFRVPQQQRHPVPGMGQQMGQRGAPASAAENRRRGRS